MITYHSSIELKKCFKNINNKVSIQLVMLFPRNQHLTNTKNTSGNGLNEMKQNLFIRVFILYLVAYNQAPITKNIIFILMFF